MKRRSLFFFIILLLPVLACGQFILVNPSDNPVTVRVTLPDEAYGVRQLAPGESDTWYAFTGGNYKVEILQGDAYLNQLKENRDLITDILLAEGSVEKPSAMLAAVYWLGNVQTEIDKVVEQGTICTGKIPEGSMEIFDIDAGTQDVTVALKFDPFSEAWSCGE